MRPYCRAIRHFLVCVFFMAVIGSLRKSLAFKATVLPIVLEGGGGTSSTVTILLINNCGANNNTWESGNRIIGQSSGIFGHALAGTH